MRCVVKIITEEILGVTRAISDPDNVDAEFAVLVRSNLKGLGLGRRLMEKLIAYTEITDLYV
ncbi:GNAT family N-acetyltransferase [Shigella flexneri]